MQPVTMTNADDYLPYDDDRGATQQNGRAFIIVIMTSNARLQSHHNIFIIRSSIINLDIIAISYNAHRWCDALQ